MPIFQVAPNEFIIRWNERIMAAVEFNPEMRPFLTSRKVVRLPNLDFWELNGEDLMETLQSHGAESAAGNWMEIHDKNGVSYASYIHTDIGDNGFMIDDLVKIDPGDWIVSFPVSIEGEGKTMTGIAIAPYPSHAWQKMKDASLSAEQEGLTKDQFFEKLLNGDYEVFAKS